jgi:hypothetical protein
MSAFRIKAIDGGEHYSLSDGTTIVTGCPCCDKPLTLAAAQALINKVHSRYHGIASLKELVELYASYVGRGGEGAGELEHA